MFHSFGEVKRTAAKPKENKSSDKMDIYDCDLCDSGDWLSETEVELHKKSMHSVELGKMLLNTPNACKTCAKVFPDYNTLIEHIKSDHFYSSKTARRVEREIFVCDFCSQIFFSKHLLTFHMVHRHRRKPHSILLKCPLCLKKISSKVIYSHLNHHYLRSVSVCQICLRKQKNRKVLAQHMETHPKHYLCNICGYIATREKDFNMHIDLYERRKKRFEVKNFKEYFLQPVRKIRWVYNSLKVGLQGLIIYNDVYICVLCRQICTNYNDMQEHILRDHSAEPKAVDTVVMKVCMCGEQFTNMIMFKHHILKNKGQHRLSCTELVQSAGEDSSDGGLAIDTDVVPEAEPEQEVIYSYIIETEDSASVDKDV